MYKHLQNIALLILCQSPFVYSQNTVIGNSYSALIGTSCKELTNGGCIIKNYCGLKFSKTTVQLFYFAEAYCSEKDLENFYEKNARRDTITLRWSQNDTIITIKNFDNLSPLSIHKEALIGTLEIDEKKQGTEFKLLKYQL